MATVTGLTAEKMKQLSNAYIVDADVNEMGNLILTTAGGTQIDAGTIIPGGTVGQYYRGDKQWATLNKAAVGLDKVDNVSVLSNYIPKWLPNTLYLAGSIVISPLGELVKAKAGFTSAATYNSSNWSLVALGDLITRRNYSPNPLAIGSSTGFGSYIVGTGEAGTTTFITGAVDGPLPEVTTYARWAVTTPKTAGSSGWRGEAPDQMGVTSGVAGDTRSIDVYIRYNGPGTISVIPRVSFFNSGAAVNSVASAAVVLNSGQWVRLSASGAATGAFTHVGWWLYSLAASVAPASSQIDVTAALISNQTGPFFSGASASDSIKAYGWSGPVNNSASTETSRSTGFVPKWRSGNVYAIGDQVITPNSLVVTANVAHTASSSFSTDSSKWDDGPLSKGRVLRRTVGVSSANITTTETVIYNIPSYTFKAGRKYKIEWDSDWHAASANSTGDFHIATCAVGDSASVLTGLTRIGLRTGQVVVQNVSSQIHVTAFYEPTVDTTVQLKFTAQVINGTTLVVQGNRVGKVEYTITDEGNQY